MQKFFILHFQNVYKYFLLNNQIQILQLILQNQITYDFLIEIIHFNNIYPTQCFDCDV